MTSDPKKALPALSGAVFRPESRRGRGNVQALWLLLADFDNAEERPTGEYHRDSEGKPTNRPVLHKACLGDPVRPEAVLDELWRRGVAAYLYTTWSHSEVWPRFRLVVPLAHSLAPDLWGRASEWALEHMGLLPFRRGLDLPVLRDTARMHFLPAAPAGQEVRRWRSDGRALVVSLEELGRSQSKPLELSLWQRRILAQRALDGRWRPRLGVDLCTLDLAGLLSSRGIQVGEPRAYGVATKWRTHCPWAREHSHGLDDDCGVIIHSPGHRPIWKCAHSHHAHLGLRDVLEVCGGLL